MEVIPRRNFSYIIAQIAVILTGGLLLCQMAFYNLFPLVYSDTGTYISSGFTGRVPIDRPIIYGLFIRHMSMAETLWAVILCQGIIVSYLIYCLIKAHVVRINHNLFFFLTIFTLIFSSCVSQKVSTLMPDIFAATSGLSLILLSIKNGLRKVHIVLIGIIFIFSNVVHYTHAYIALLTLFTLFVILIFKKIDKEYFSWKRFLILISLTCFSLILTPTIHYFFGGGFETSRGKHVFLTGKLIQNGVLVDFLQKNCSSNEYELCKYKDTIASRDFLWDTRSPLYKTGGWENSSIEYNRMLNDVFASPHHLIMFIYKSIESTMIQFFSFQTDVLNENLPMDSNSAPFGQVQTYFHHQLSDFIASKQNCGKLDYQELNSRQNLLIFFSFLALVFLVFNRKMLKSSFIILILCCMLFVFYNAMLCGSLSLPNSRYQSRVMWLLPLVFGVVIFNSNLRLKEKINKFLK